MRLSLCLLTWNELAGCQLDVPGLPLDQFEEIFAIDGGSTDGTVEYLDSAGIPVHEQPEPGLNAACNYAFEKCTTDAIVFFHPKGSVPPADVLKFRPLFSSGAGLVVATRCSKGGRNEEDVRLLKPRKWFVKGLAILAALLWRREGQMIWDVLHGFRGMTVEAFRAIGARRYGPTIDLEMVVRSYRLRIPRVEFPTVERPRPSGKSHFKAIPTGWRLLRYLVAEFLVSRGRIGWKKPEG